MSGRPEIPIKIQREVLFEARHRCAVCCDPTPLEQAHIIAWSKSKNHSLEKLIALCANCHERSPKWTELRKLLASLKATPKPPPAAAPNICWRNIKVRKCAASNCRASG